MLAPPPILRLLGHTELATDGGGICAAGEHPVSLTELADDLVRGVTLSVFVMV